MSSYPAMIWRHNSTFILLLVGFATSGCALERGIRESGEAAGPDMVLGPARASGGSQVDIDADATLTVNAGDEVGVFVQYARGGHWNLSTSCDTRVSRQSCAFDIVIRPEEGAAFSGVEGQELTRDDSIELRDDGSIRLLTTTSYGLDGIVFDTTPGALVEIDVQLDGVSQPRFIHAVSAGSDIGGAPENPVAFIPSEP